MVPPLIQVRVTAHLSQTSNKVLTDNAVLRSALRYYHAENSGMSYSYKPPRRLTPTGGSLCRSILYLVPVIVFKGISIVTIYYIENRMNCQGLIQIFVKMQDRKPVKRDREKKEKKISKKVKKGVDKRRVL